VQVLKLMREELIKLGVDIRFETKATELIFENTEAGDEEQEQARVAGAQQAEEEEVEEFDFDAEVRGHRRLCGYWCLLWQRALGEHVHCRHSCAARPTRAHAHLS
jgi:flavin-dependent dehydrogenase